jgi:hypothetical protein
MIVHDRSLSWLGAATSIKSGGVRLVLWTQTSTLRLSRNWRQCTTLFPVFKMLCFNITLRLAEIVFCGLTHAAVNYWCLIYIYMSVFMFFYIPVIILSSSWSWSYGSCTFVISAYHHLLYAFKPRSGEVYSVHHYVIKMWQYNYWRWIPLHNGMWTFFKL